MRLWKICLALAFSAFLLVPLAEAQKGTHKDPRLGFSIKPPRGWGEVPIPSGEEWIVAKYQTPKEDLVYDKESGQSWRHKPRLIATAFLDEAMTRPDVEEDEETGETRIRFSAPYQSYEDYVEQYLQSNYGTGYFKEDEGDGELKGVTYRWMEIKAEGIGRPSLRVLTWIYQTDLGEVAIQLECMEDKYKKNKKTYEKTLKSFRLIERTESLDLGGTSLSSFVSLATIGSLSPDERRLRRQEQERQEWAKMTKDLPKGWTAKEIDGVNVLNHTDDRHAKKVVERIRATQRWLDETFENIGPGEYTRSPIVRICENRDERNLFFSGTGRTGGTELTTYKDKQAGAMSSTLEYISQRTMDIWMVDRDQEIWLYMPAWLNVGLDQVVGTASVKGKKLEFNADWWERILKDAIRQYGESEPTPARSLMVMLDRDFADSNLQTAYDAMCLVRMLVTTRSKKYRQVLPDYLANIKSVLDEIQAEEKEGDDKLEKPKNEEEEEAYIEARRKKARERESRLLEEALSRTFADWSDSDWKAFENEFEKSK